MESKYPYIASGFREDCQQLLTTFQNENDIRFETFCRCWQDMKFSLVFSCRENFSDLLEFCEETIHIAKQFFIEPITFKERIGGLYLLYGLYYKMPLENLVKIRITLSEFQQIMKLHHEIRVGEHFDANFVLSKMFVDNAFTFCLFSKEIGLKKQQKLQRIQNLNNSLSLLPSSQNKTIQDGLLERINALSKQYVENKNAFAKNVGLKKSVSLFDSNIVENMMSEFCSMNKSSDSAKFAEGNESRLRSRRAASKIRLGCAFDIDSEEENDEETEGNDKDEEVEGEENKISENRQSLKHELKLGLEEDYFDQNYFSKVEVEEEEHLNEDF